jgi:hypothetical protein
MAGVGPGVGGRGDAAGERGGEKRRRARGMAEALGARNAIAECGERGDGKLR